MPADPEVLVDILTAARLAVEFVEGYDEENFLRDRKTQAAVLHELLVLGEAVKRLSSEFRADHPETPWKKIAGMRDELIHEYDTVDLEEVWRTVSSDVPALISRLEPLAPTAEP